MRLKKLFPNLIAPILFAVLCAASCQPPGPTPTPPVDTHLEGIYILNEGLFQHNNSTLSYYDFTNETLHSDLFVEVNQRGLGDTGNDLQRYGSKLYCVVNNSHRVDVLDFATARSVKVISLPGKSPRYITFYQGKAFVSCFDGDVVRIDTATLEVDLTARSGNNPEGLCVCNGKLYVANSGGLNNPDYDKTVSIFDAGTLTLLKTLEVGVNPYRVHADGESLNVYVCSRGDYIDHGGTLSRIDARTDQVTRTWQNVQNFTLFGNKAYVYEVDYNGGANPVNVIDLDHPDEEAQPFITDGTAIQMPYCISVNPLNEDVYIADSHDFTVTGDVYCFDKEGKRKFSFPAGLNPCAIVFKY